MAPVTALPELPPVVERTDHRVGGNPQPLAEYVAAPVANIEPENMVRIRPRTILPVGPGCVQIAVASLPGHRQVFRLEIPLRPAEVLRCNPQVVAQRLARQPQLLLDIGELPVGA